MDAKIKTSNDELGLITEVDRYYEDESNGMRYIELSNGLIIVYGDTKDTSKRLILPKELYHSTSFSYTPYDTDNKLYVETYGNYLQFFNGSTSLYCRYLVIGFR